ncbi:VPLPA-CTERM sorting domain-containing protein [Sneathiella marina]|uniref:VPLPA-CTERM sorting domain-containing protein n=1 Tax=Sneathiella marina TaxID=2950108 RepID=A0ABY4W6I8_9PROT|nr:VPLPA-CTERM sorting domain-containing protein [Sneathiella marina]USG62796.1 VPLPA-CTERM sorting domain-containing protein [Sneathiella marina]
MKNFLATLAILAFTATSAQAAIITELSDNFDSEGTPQANYAGFTNWDITEGTVDLVGPGYFANLCREALGDSCVDLDGSTKDAGVMTSKDEFAAGTYDVSFWISGNQRTGTDVVEFFFGDYVETFELAFSDPWELVERTISPSGPAPRFGFECVGGDNICAVIDDIEVKISAVPLPAALPLFGAALIGIGLLSRRKKATALRRG